MDALAKEYDVVAKRQRILAHSTLSIIDHLIEGINECKARCGSPTRADQPRRSSDEGAGGALKQLISHTKDETEKLSAEYKDFISTVGKLGKSIDKTFHSNISKLANPDAFKNKTYHVHRAVVDHLYYTGRFALADNLAQAAGEMEVDDSPHKQILRLMVTIASAIRAKNLAPALGWVEEHEAQLQQSGNRLPYAVHRLRYIQLLAAGKVDEALHIAQTHLGRLGDACLTDVKRLMAACLYVDNLSHSRYADLLDDKQWDELGTLFLSSFCSLNNIAKESPLARSINAGCMALPKLIKMLQVLETTQRDDPLWASLSELPVEIDLGKERQFHTIFCCPVSREQSTPSNPPMRLPCGHVICRESLNSLARNFRRRFKCPYCPHEMSVADATEVIF